MNETFSTKFIQVARTLTDFDNQVTRTLPLPQDFKQKRIAANESIYSLLVVFHKKGSHAEIVAALGAMGKALADYSFVVAKIGLEVAVTVLAFMSGTGEILLILCIILFVMTVIENEGKISPSTFLVFLGPLLGKFKWGIGVLSKLKAFVKMPATTSIKTGTMAASNTISNMGKASVVAEATSAGQPLLKVTMASKMATTGNMAQTGGNTVTTWVGPTMASKMATTGTAVKNGMNAADYSLQAVNTSKAMSGAISIVSPQKSKVMADIMETLKKVLAELKLDEKMKMLVDTIRKLIDDFAKAWQKAGDSIQQKVASQARTTAAKTAQPPKVVRPYQSPYSPQNVHEATQMIRRYTTWN